MPLPIPDPRVLLVEDDPDNATVALDLLRLAGVTRIAHVATLSAIPDALATLGRADLILLDINLPDGDARLHLPRLRALPACAGARMVAVTASVMPDDVADARAAGFDAFIGKPLDFDRFADQIRAILCGETVWHTR